jgi:hypothetical protein
MLRVAVKFIVLIVIMLIVVMQIVMVPRILALHMISMRQTLLPTVKHSCVATALNQIMELDTKCY